MDSKAIPAFRGRYEASIGEMRDMQVYRDGSIMRIYRSDGTLLHEKKIENNLML